MLRFFIILVLIILGVLAYFELSRDWKENVNFDDGSYVTVRISESWCIEQENLFARIELMEGEAFGKVLLASEDVTKNRCQFFTDFGQSDSAKIHIFAYDGQAAEQALSTNADCVNSGFESQSRDILVCEDRIENGTIIASAKKYENGRALGVLMHFQDMSKRKWYKQEFKEILANTKLVENDS